MGTTIEKIKKEFKLTPQEALAEIHPIRKSLYIGVPKEAESQEKRIALTPNSVAALTNQGHRIMIESGAGEYSNFEDSDYTHAGAQLVSSKEEVYKADVILKSAHIDNQEVQYIQTNQTIFSTLLTPSLNKNLLKRLMQLKVTALAYDYIKTSESYFPYIESMGDIAGSYSVILAGKYLSNEFGRGILIGGIAGQPPCKILIIGAGNVGLAAARTAMGLGAQIQMFDDNVQLLQRAKNILRNNIYTSVIDPLNLKKNLSRADVAIGALHHSGGQVSKIVSESMVANMKNGAVIIDTSMNHGGCFETSMVTPLDAPIYIKHGVIHYCVPNITSEVSRTASYAMSNLLSPIFRKIGQCGGVDQLITSDIHFRNGVYIYKGLITKEHIANEFDLSFRDIDLLLTSQF